MFYMLCGVSAVPVRLINTLESGSLANRKVVLLPSSIEYQSLWENLGITWIEQMNRETFLVKALLPEGWNSREVRDSATNLLNVTLIDSTQVSRVEIIIIPGSRKHEVKFLSQA